MPGSLVGAGAPTAPRGDNCHPPASPTTRARWSIIERDPEGPPRLRRHPGAVASLGSGVLGRSSGELHGKTRSIRPFSRTPPRRFGHVRARPQANRPCSCKTSGDSGIVARSLRRFGHVRVESQAIRAFSSTTSGDSAIFGRTLGLFVRISCKTSGGSSIFVQHLGRFGHFRKKYPVIRRLSARNLRRFGHFRAKAMGDSAIETLRRFGHVRARTRATRRFSSQN